MSDEPLLYKYSTREGYEPSARFYSDLVPTLAAYGQLPIRTRPQSFPSTGALLFKGFELSDMCDPTNPEVRANRASTKFMNEVVLPKMAEVDTQVQFPPYFFNGYYWGSSESGQCALVEDQVLEGQPWEEIDGIRINDLPAFTYYGTRNSENDFPWDLDNANALKASELFPSRQRLPNAPCEGGGGGGSERPEEGLIYPRKV